MVLFRLVHWIPGVPQDLNWLYDMAGDKQALKGEVEELGRYALLSRSSLRFTHGLFSFERRVKEAELLTFACWSHCVLNEKSCFSLGDRLKHLNCEANLAPADSS